MSDEKTKLSSDDKREEKLESSKKPTSRKKTSDDNNDASKNEVNKSKVIEKLQAMGVMSGGSPRKDKISEPEKSGFLKVAIASITAVAVVGSFVWALDQEGGHIKTADNLNTASETDSRTAQPNSLQQWGPASLNQQNTNPSRFNSAYQDNSRKYHEMQQQRMQQYRQQQQKWMQQQQEQRQKWIDQQRQAYAQYQQQAFRQHPSTKQMPAQPNNKWMDQQRTQQRNIQQQQRIQNQWRQPYASHPPTMNQQAQVVPPSYNNVPGYQQPVPYNYYGR